MKGGVSGGLENVRDNPLPTSPLVRGRRLLPNPCYKVLAIELVGDVHGYKSRERFDSIRAKKIESLGIKILSYTNMQIQDEMDGVLDDILSNLPLTPSFIRRGNRPGTFT